MNNNNNQKTTTRKYSTTTYTPRNSRGRKHNQNKLVFFILLALLIIALITAIVIVVADLIGQQGDTTDPIGTGGDGTAVIPGPGGHSLTHAYDGDPATYMLSVMKQSAGSYFSCEFSGETVVGSIKINSSEAEHYIRGADIQLKVGGEWVTVGQFDAVGEKNFDTSPLEINATALRILLTAEADAYWAVNEITVTDISGNKVALGTAAAGTNAGTEDSGTATTDSVVTTKPQPGMTTITLSNENIYKGELILVNAQYEYKFPTSNANLLNLYAEYVANDYHCNYFDDTAASLDATATRYLFAMLNAMKAETGLNSILVGTGYRSYQDQQAIANKYPASAALPGFSEHHTGLGIDLNGWIDGHPYPFDDVHPTVQQMHSWITANAYKYGYVRRFAPDKDLITGITTDRWHYRYVGVPHAYYMSVNNLCLEEYLAALENCTYGSNHLIIDNADGKSYEIYYVPASGGTSTEIPVPDDPGSYSVSGNNYGGFIVTITR